MHDRKRQQQVQQNFNQSAFTSRFFATNSPNNVTLSQANYLIPKFNEYEMNMFQSQDNYLEKSWEGLSSFRKLHKGRLDSAKVNNTKPNKIINVGE